MAASELAAGRPHAYISCCKTLKLRCLLASALAQLSQGGKRKRAQAYAAAAGSESSLIWELAAACPADQPSRLLVLDDVQQLLAAAEGPLSSLLALREQAGANVSLLLLSRAQPSALGLLGLLPGIVAIAFAAYSEAQLVDILAAAGPPAATMPSSSLTNSSSLTTSSTQQQQQQRRLYRDFLANLVVQQFKVMSRCLPDLASQAAALWPRYLAAATAQQQRRRQHADDDEDLEVQQGAAGYAAVRERLQGALECFQPAACCSLNPAAAAAAGVQQQAGAQRQQQQQQQLGVSGKSMAAGLELCRMSKLLIISAFLASRNKPSVDRQLFDDGAGFKRRSGVRRRNVMGASRQAEAAKAAELKGPHSFSFARLMAVYANLLAADENHTAAAGSAGSSLVQLQLQQLRGDAAAAAAPGGAAAAMGGGWLGVQSADVMVGVKSLVAARLLTQACDDVLEGPRFGCEAPQELVQQLAMDCGVPLTSYLNRAEAVSSQAKYVAKRLSLSVGKAAWLASTTLLVLLVPLVIEMDREAQLLDMEKEQMSVLTSPKSS
ncbi:hypothetical protein OEZ85_011314 [Tetradesmus obliquus]|uniref:Origin recognition complex subunit 5 C-terminal domain-containing protein n=1 Tax=Tetradesmus obliquus TaxID=3088 RepID=A0ABY8TPY4_TETOB|nr:hypothetical protein OEZ85_011314 [Tetradesmus obliquus]